MKKKDTESLPEFEEDEIKIKFPSKKRRALIIFGVIFVSGLVGTYTAIEFVQSQNRIILATTTSTYDSGLLDYIIPVFEEKNGLTVEVISVGTGQALEAGEKGDADVLLVHARSLEDDFVDDGYGVHRTCVMYNDFIIIGPSSDPAAILDENITKAMDKLKSAGQSSTAKFYSRGDNSGTYIKELKLWALIGFKPDSSKDDWYLETGAGMGDTLKISNDNNGYTLIDRGTWLSSKSNVGLTDLVEGEEILLNPYGAIAVNPKVHPNVKYDYAMAFIAFLVSEEGQDLIGDFRKEGEKLFRPAFGKGDDKFGCPTTEEEVEYWKEHNGGYTGSTASLALNPSIEHPYIGYQLVYKNKLKKNQF